jgi:hypothetical protein
MTPHLPAQTNISGARTPASALGIDKSMRRFDHVTSATGPAGPASL